MGINFSSTNTIAGNSHTEEEKKKKKVELEAEVSRLMSELLQPLNIGTVPGLKDVLLNDPNLMLYLNNSVSTKMLLASFKLRISRARSILQAFKCSQDEDEQTHAATLPKLLREFKDSLFTDQFSSLCDHLQSTARQLNSRRNGIKKKLAFTKKWKKVCKVLINVVFASVLVCTVLLAAISAPPLATTAATVGTTAFKTVEQWLDSIWADRLDALKHEKDVILKAMKENNMYGAHELESIRAMLKRLEVKIGSISDFADYALANQEAEGALKMVMNDVEAKVGEIGKSVNEVEMKVSACDDEIGKAVAEFLNVIINDF